MHIKTFSSMRNEGKTYGCIISLIRNSIPNVNVNVRNTPCKRNMHPIYHSMRLPYKAMASDQSYPRNNIRLNTFCQQQEPSVHMASLIKGHRGCTLARRHPLSFTLLLRALLTLNSLFLGRAQQWQQLPTS